MKRKFLLLSCLANRSLTGQHPDMSKNLLILEFSRAAHIMYTTLKKLLWQPW